MSDIIPTVELINNQPATTSLKIAECFEKNHFHVMRDIQSLIEQCPKDFTASNFGLSEYTDSTGRKLPMYTVFFDGFILLVMGYTGKKALQMKLAYIEAFNAMRTKLEAAKKKELPHADSPITPPMQAIIQMLVKAKVEQLPDNKSRKGYYPQVYGRFNNHFGIPRYTELPQSRMAEAVQYLVNLEIRPAKKIAPAPEQKKLEAELEEPVILDGETYKHGKRLFDQLADLKMRAESLREIIHIMARPGKRQVNISPEKQVLYDNMDDAVNGAVTGMNIAFYNLRSACRIGSRTDFCKW